MAALTYVGRVPDSDATVVSKSYADSAYATYAVTTGYVSSAITAASTGLTTKTYVDAQDALRAHKTDVDAADTQFVAATALNAANGVAGLDSSGNLLSAQIPAGVRNDRVALSYSLGDPQATTFLSGSHTVTTTSPREYKIASITVPDPGFPWVALPMAMVCGGSTGASAPTSRMLGTGNYGLLSVMAPSGNTVWGIGIGSGSFYQDFIPVLPYAATNATPSVINGAQELDLFASCWSGNTYTFSDVGLYYQIWVVPGL